MGRHEARPFQINRIFCAVALDASMGSDGRKHPIHLPSIDRFNTSTIVFLTVCTKDRKAILANDSVHQTLRDVWQTKPSWITGRYVIMPDHVHLFCAPSTLEAPALKPWVKFWKANAGLRWHRREDSPIWQRDFWDTQLRRGESYNQKWEYVRQNPVRAGLVKNPDDWPYQGELNILEL